MAPIDTQTDRSKDLTIHVCTGEISVDEILTALQKFWFGEVTKAVLWDMVEAEPNLHEPEIHNIDTFLQQIQRRKLGYQRRGGKTALVGASQYIFRILRQFKAWADTVGDIAFEFQVFNDIEEAMQWLTTEE
jgi:hypothetical protein